METRAVWDHTMRSTLLLLATLCAVVAQDTNFPFPVVLPPYGLNKVSVGNKEAAWGACLFYLESLNVYVLTKEKISAASIGSNTDNQFEFKNDYVSCTNATKDDKTPGKYIFQIETILKNPAKAETKDKTVDFEVADNVGIKLTFTSFPTGAWGLSELELTKDLTVKKGALLPKDTTVPKGTKADAASLQRIQVGAYYNYNYACSQTKAAVFTLPDEKSFQIGIGFGNVQVQRDGLAVDGEKVHFTRLTHDCVGTFSSSSWMGIIVALLLASVLMFGFLMLNSVQTIDRFDDPKQKQLVINSKD